VEDYQSPRDTAVILAYYLDKLEKFGYVLETKQLINNEIIKEECESKGISIFQEV
jgi:hypothetical protein